VVQFCIKGCVPFVHWHESARPGPTLRNERLLGMASKLHHYPESLKDAKPPFILYSQHSILNLWLLIC